MTLPVLPPPSPDPDAVVQTHGLRKTYGRHVALEALDLRVGPGQVIGLLGPNGAGKTTAVKLLLGLARPSAGGGTLLGRPLGDRRARASVGYLPELFRYPQWLSAREVVALHCQLAGLPRASWRGWTERALSTVGLEHRARDRVGHVLQGHAAAAGPGPRTPG